MTNFFDEYEIRARIFPAILIVSPLIFPLVPIINKFGLKASDTIYVFVVFCAFIYLISLLIRFRSKRKEGKNWLDWGDAPSTLLLLNSDTVIGSTTKKVLREKILSDFKIEIIPDSENEKKLIAEAFFLVKSLLREDKLLYKHNCEYGFLRNLTGNYYYWLITSIVSVIISTAVIILNYSHIALFALILNIIYLLTILLVSHKGLKKHLKRAGFTYAETAWASYYHYNINCK